MHSVSHPIFILTLFKKNNVIFKAQKGFQTESDKVCVSKYFQSRHLTFGFGVSIHRFNKKIIFPFKTCFDSKNSPHQKFREMGFISLGEKVLGIFQVT